jgi:hypothetical protein
MKLARVTGLLATLVVAGSPAARAESVGTSCEDCATTVGAFTLVNQTGSPIHYSVKWGSGGNWNKIALASGRIETHSHALDGNGRAPTPYVIFDKVLNDGKVTDKEYRMEFAQVVHGGFGPRRPNEPMHYRFVQRDGRFLDIVKE